MKKMIVVLGLNLIIGVTEAKVFIGESQAMSNLGCLSVIIAGGDPFVRLRKSAKADGLKKCYSEFGSCMVLDDTFEDFDDVGCYSTVLVKGKNSEIEDE